jgi:ABC-2 type transport system permease protein
VNGLRLYQRLIGVSLRSQMEYRASFLMLSVGQFVLTAIEFGVIWALFDRFGAIRGWTLPEVALFYGLISIAFSIADATGRGFDLFGTTVKQGDFDRLLLRPRSTVLQLFGQELTLRRIGRFSQGVAVLTYALTSLDLAWSPDRVALLGLSIGSAACLFLGLVVLQATSAFWTTEALEVWNAFTYGGVTMGQYPLAIYPSWFQRLFIYVVPIACTSYFPVIAILGRPDPLGTSFLFQRLAPLAGPLFLFASLQVWKLGVRRYQSTGS